MKVKNRHIILDDELIKLDDVVMIDVAQAGSPFENARFYLNVVYDDGSSREIDIIEDRVRLRVMKQLNTIGKVINDSGMNNFVNIDFALVNMDNLKSIKYIKKEGKIEIVSLRGYINSFKASPNQAKHSIDKLEDAYDKYMQSRVQ